MSWSSDDIDVLIDMLDDPLRREFAAYELSEHGSVVGMTHEQVCRAAEVAGLHKEKPVRAAWVRPSLGGLAGKFQCARERELWADEIQQVFFYAGQAFKTYEEAEAYKDFQAWRKEK